MLESKSPHQNILGFRPKGHVCAKSLNGTVLTFVPALDYCNTHNDSVALVQFRVVAFGGQDNDRVVSTSPLVTQEIHVECKRDMLALSVPDKEHHVIQQTFSGMTSEQCRADESSCEGVLTIEDINVTSIDLHNATALMIVECSDDAFVTFNEEHWNKTVPLYGRREVSGGQSLFRASPVDLTDILSNLRFQSLEAGSQWLNITTQYGDGCESVEIVGRCQVLSRSIRIEVREADRPKLPRVKIPFDRNYFISFAVSFIILPTGGCIWLLLYGMVENEEENENDSSTDDDEDRPLATLLAS